MSEFSWEKGWIQRSNRNAYQPGELIDAVNVIPDPEGGGIATRLGDTLHGTVGASVHSLYSTYTAAQVPVQYQGAGSVLNRNFVPIVTGLTGAPLTFATMPGFGEKTVYTFFAGGQEALRVKDNGAVITNWGIKPPALPINAGTSSTGGFLEGHYAWRQVYVRKPVIAGGVWGRWTNATNSYTLTGGYPWFITDNLGVNNGTVFGAPEPWEEVRLDQLSGGLTPGGQVDYAYWNGQSWVIWITTIFGIYNGTTFDLRNSFSFNAWIPLNGLYLLRMRILVNPPVVPGFNAATFYDGTFAARSNPSPPGLAAGPFGATPLNNAAGVIFSSAFILPDSEPQVTHVAIYRTTGDDAALTTSGLTPGEALYFFERDYPVGANTHLSITPDNQLGELLEIDNDRPIAFDTIAEYQERIFGAKGNQLWFSKRGFPEAFPGTNYLNIGSLADPIRRVAQYHGQLYIWTKSRIYLLLGESEESYNTRLVQCPTGLGAPQSVAEGERAIYFIGSDGHLWALQGTIAANISRLGHQQLFEGVALHGVSGINPAALSACVGYWGRGQYLLAYPAFPATVPSTSLLIDEARGSWWRDTRAWRALFYDRQANMMYGGLVDGKVVRLSSGLTDHGAPITGTLQTRDDDAGLHDGSKDLSQLVVELRTSATGVTVNPVVSYIVATTPLGTLISPTPDQLILPSPAPDTYRGLTFGYVLTGTAPWALYGLIPHMLRLPVRLRSWYTLPLTLSWPGPKILDSLLLDIEVRSGTVTWQLMGDDVLVEDGTITTLGRHVWQLLTMRHEATVFSLTIQGTGIFLLYDGSVVRGRPLPPPIYTHIIVPTDLGIMQDKIGLAYTLDIDLLAPGTVTTTFYADGVLIHTLIYTTEGRLRSERFRLPATMRGRLMEIRTQSTALYRLWSGTDYEYMIVGQPTSQHYRQVTEPYGVSTPIPLLQLPHTEEV